MAHINVELQDGSTALNSFGHSFNTLEDAKEYLSRNGGGTIVIVPDDWDVYEIESYQHDFEYECDREVLIVVDADDDWVPPAQAEFFDSFG